MNAHVRTNNQYQITEQDIKQYEEKGYLVLENVITDEELVVIEKWCDHFVEGNERHRYGPRLL
jgi:ectoine hydroxylase-related dioxygenase (phytanoyl-CoA dioxygenase family)